MNIAELLDSLGVEYATEGHGHCTQGWLQLSYCPSCSLPNDRNFRLGVHTKGLAWNCWQCGRLRGGECLSAITGRPLGECLKLLGECDRDYSPRELSKRKGKLIVPDGLGELLPAHRKYLSGRGIDPDYASEIWGMKGIGRNSRLPWRLWLPVRLDRVLSWTTRTIGNKGIRYVSASPEEEEVPIKELLYGEELAGNSVIVVEGPLDAIRVGEGAVATLGIQWTKAQMLRLSRPRKRILCFDNEWKAQQKARELADALECYPGQTLVVEIDADDPGCASDKEIRALRRLL